MNISQFVYPLTDGQLGVFQVKPILNKAAKKIHVKLSLPVDIGFHFC